MSWRLSLIRKLSVCLAAGLIAAASAWWYVARAERRLNRRYETVKVLRARRYIAPDKPVTADAVEEIDIPSAFVQPTALATKAELKDAAGRAGFKSRAGILKGEQIARSKLYDESAALGLAWSLAPGQTALTLRLPAERAVGGFLAPGDWVHVLCTIEKQPGWETTRTRLLLPRVQAIAVDRRTIRDGAGASPPAVATESILVTLSLASKQAVALTLAATKGDVTLVLAAPLDAAPTAGTESSLNTLHGNF